jgi:hypothetical protein
VIQNVGGEGLLTALNNNPRFDLNNTLSLTLGDSIETNPYVESKIKTLFYEPHVPPPPSLNPNSSTFLSLNIRSLMSHHPQLNSLITDLVNLGANIQAIALQEVWALPHPDLVKINGFTLITKLRKNGRGGGVGFYIRDSLKFKIRDDLSPFFENMLESLTIEICDNNKKTILCNYYRPPTPITSADGDFFTNFDMLLHNISLRNLNTFIFSDTNINLLKLPNNALANSYLDLVHSNGFLQLISKATRIEGDSYSLIDHILCKNFKPEFETGTVILDISDHFMNFITIPQPHKTKDVPPPKKDTFFLTK